MTLQSPSSACGVAMMDLAILEDFTPFPTIILVGRGNELQELSSHKRCHWSMNDKKSQYKHVLWCCWSCWMWFLILPHQREWCTYKTRKCIWFCGWLLYL